MLKINFKIILSIVTVVTIFFAGNFFDLYSQNLILNPGCEDSLINGEIPYWSEVIGTGWTQRANGNPPTHEGDYMFFAGAINFAELQQDVDVSSLASTIDSSQGVFCFEGFVRAYNQSPPDQSRIILEYFNQFKTTKLDSFDSGNYSTASEWVRIADTTQAPVGTRFIRIRLISTRRAGTNNDGYYDALSLEYQNISGIERKNNWIPATLKLFQNFPNPFNPKTNIQFSIPEPGYVTLKIYNALGQEVETLVSEKLLTGRYNYTWDATGFASGIYIYKIETENGFLQTRKLILLK